MSLLYPIIVSFFFTFSYFKLLYTIFSPRISMSIKLFISPAYLNLMESGKRKIDLDLLVKMANELNIDVSDISKKNDTNLYQNLMDLLGDNLFENLDITNFDVKELINTNLSIAKALVKLGDNYKK